MKKMRWNPNKFKKNMLNLGAGVLAFAVGTGLFIILGVATFASWV